MFMDITQCQHVQHKAGNCDVKDTPRSGRPITGKFDEIIQKIEQDGHINSHDIDQKLNIDHKTVLNYCFNTEKFNEFFCNPSKIERVWLESFDASTMQT